MQDIGKTCNLQERCPPLRIDSNQRDKGALAREELVMQ